MNQPMPTITQHLFDVVVVGAGGAGLRAALGLSESSAKVAVLSKVLPTRSHTVSAQGGINAALGNGEEDSWHWHMYDTVKGSDYLGDQDAIEYMCRAAPRLVLELEHLGVPFSRNEDGTVYQRPFGGQSKKLGEGGQAARTCAAADRTGHAVLHTLYQQNLRVGTTFFNEFQALELIRDDEGTVLGVLAWDIVNGGYHLFQGKATVIATGGAGRLFRTSTNAHINTGDGMALALNAGLQLEDMEFFQFHPTGIAGVGILISEAVRGEGGYLVNGEGERFMSRYAPHVLDLASRDVVARAIATEVAQGRGIGGGDRVHLKVDHLDPEVIKSRLPGIRELSIKFAGVDPIKAPIPVYPSAHYTMGGIPTNRFGEVVEGDMSGEKVVPGFYAIGECACVSVHGANRLGGNSLLDIVVFGRACANKVLEQLAGQRYHKPLPEGAGEAGVAKIEALLARVGREGPSTAELRTKMQTIMDRYCGVFRTDAVLAQGEQALAALAQEVAASAPGFAGRPFNTALTEHIELLGMMELARAVAASARARTESRGAHFRQDYPERDDAHFQKHTLARLDGGGIAIDYKPVRTQPLTVETFAPKPRVY
ncbi:MAG: succinate dehydrogenase flavoprotein subunit [Proteobacteria bacterium CG1_02_64_396]|nr:MAG: succinate dehydrogenase flavoprotein subunit [Proteobacteria bacterium CG1_02_64_396]